MESNLQPLEFEAPPPKPKLTIHVDDGIAPRRKSALFQLDDEESTERASREKEAAQPFPPIDAQARIVDRFGRVMFLGAVHKKTPLWYVWTVRIMLCTCIMVCGYNSIDGTRTYRNKLFAMVLMVLHLAVFWTHIVMTKVLRSSEWSSLMDYAHRMRSRTILRTINILYWGYFVGVGAVTGAIYAGWTVPIFLSLARPLPIEEDPALRASLVIHGVSLTILIVPWVLVFVECIILYAIFLTIFRVAIRTIRTNLEGRFMAVARDRRDSELFRNGVVGGTWGGLALGNAPARSPRSALSPSTVSATDMTPPISGSPTPPAELRTPDDETVVPLVLDTPVVHRFSFKELDIRVTLGEIIQLDKWVRPICNDLSWAFVVWIVLSTLLFMSGSLNLVWTWQDPTTQLASVFRWTTAVEGAHNDLPFHLCQDLFYVLGGLVFLVLIPYWASRLSTITMQLERTLLQLPIKLARFDTNDLQLHLNMLDYIRQIGMGYYVFDARFTPVMAIVLVTCCLGLVAIVHLVAFL